MTASRPAAVRRCLGALVGAILWLGGPACGRSEPAPVARTPQRGGTVVIGIGAEPKSLLPYAPSSIEALTVESCLFPVLADTDSDLVSFSPILAKSWEWSPNRDALTFHLRDDVRWGDGVPVTAADVQFTWDVARDSLVAWRSIAWKKDVVGCDVIDPHTVRFRVRNVGRETFRFTKEGFVLPKHRLQDVPRAQWAGAAFGQQPIGAGPFQLQSWDKSQRIVLVRNDNYWDKPKPYIDRLVFQIVADPSNRARMLEAGTIDFVDGVPERDAARWLETPSAPVRIARCRGRDYDYLAYNPRDPLFATAKVREALGRAIDRQALVRSICHGFAELLEGPVVPTLWGYDASLEPTPYDPPGARRLLAEEGWKDSDGDGWLDRDGKRFEFEILVGNDVERRRDIVVPIQANWKAIGIKAEIRMLEKETARGLREDGKFQVAVGGWGSNLALNLEPIWGCKKGRNNFIGFCNPRVDSLNAAQLKLPLEAAKPLVFEVQRLIAAERPYTWLYAPQTVVGTSRRLHDVQVDARGGFNNPDAWWVEEAPAARR